QATSSQPGLPMSRAICADTMKMPEPIIEPTTTMVESYRPSPRLNSVSSSVAAVELAIGDSCITILPGFGIRDSGFGWGCGMRDAGCGIRPMETLNREEAWRLLNEYTKSESLLKHALAVEAAVRGYARKFGEDEEAWGVAALLHGC